MENKDILVIGDPHFKNDNSIFTDKLESEVLRIINKYKINKVVILGDILDNHGIAYMNPFNRALRFIKSIGELCQLYVLIGNHDRINNKVYTGDEHFFKYIKLNNVKFIDEIEIIDNILYAPYHDKGELVKSLKSKNIDLSELDVAFSHQEYYFGEWKEEWCPMYTGHIHEKNQLQDNLYYVGTPYQINYGDKDDKSVIIVSSSDYSCFNELKLKIPKKMSIHADYSMFLNIKFDSNSFIKLTITDTNTNINHMMNTVKWKNMNNNPLIKVKIISLPSVNKVIKTKHKNIDKMEHTTRINYKDMIRNESKKLKSEEQEYLFKYL